VKKIILLITLVACSGTTKGVKDGAKATLSCVEESLLSKASQLVPTFVGILTGNTTTWKQQAKVLGKEFGKDAAVCAARTALEKITNPVQASPEEDPEEIKKKAVARVRELEIEEGYSE
jgi:hypothetical protein